MDKFIEIKSISLEKLNAGEYAQFLDALVKLVAKTTPEKLNLKEGVFEGLQSSLRLLTESLGQSYVRKETKQLSALDKERSKLAVFLLSSIRLEKKNIDDKRSEAAGVLYDATKNYVGVQSLPVRSKTQFINSMIFDLNKLEYSPLVTILGLAKTLLKLQETNQEYQKISEGRTESQVTSNLVSFNTIKKEVNVLYRTVVKYASATHLLQSSQDTISFIEMLNKIIDQTHHANKQRLGQAQSNKKQVVEKQ